MPTPRHPLVRAFVLALLSFACASPATSVAARPVGANTGSAHARVPDLPAPSAHVPRARPIDVEHYALDLRIDPRARSLDGTCRVRFWPVEGVAGIDYVELDLVDLDVRRVTDRRGHALVYRLDEGVLGVSLDERLSAGEFEELAIDYGGTPTRGMWFVNPRDGVATQVFTQGECQDARGWFPCVDEPDDRATSEVRVTMPKSWTSVAAGERCDRTELDGADGKEGLVRESWRMDTPHPSYLETLVAGEFAARTSDAGGIPLVCLAEPASATEIDPTFACTADILSFFGTVTGARYPYSKYAQACVANFPFGGMENISATTLTDTAVTDERGRRDGDSRGLVAHEAAHQWFGDLMTCADWSHVWLNEGFATYMGALDTEHALGVDEFRVQMRGAQDANVDNDLGAKSRPIVWNVYRQPMDLFFTGHVYQGGAARLHLLRFVLGDDAFFRGIQLYVGRNRGRSVVTDDLRRALEEASGRDLRPFFAQWFESPGHPDFAVSWKYDAAAKTVALKVEQVQDTKFGAPEAFATPVEVEIATNAGDSGAKPVVSVRRIEVSRRSELFSFACDEEPRWVLFDAHGWVPKRCDDRKTGHEWLAILGGCDDVNFRRDAVKALKKLAAAEKASGTFGDEAHSAIVAAFVQSATADSSAAVRQAAVDALGELRIAGARELLLDLAAHAEKSSLRCAAFDALGRFGADAELARFAEAQFDAGWSWNAMAHAASLRGKAGPTDAFAWIAARRGVVSPHATLEAQLVTLLGTLDKADAGDSSAARDELVRTLLDEREDEAVRVSAANALAPRVQLEGRVVDAFLGLLQTPWHRLRRAAVTALVASKEQRVIDVLARHWARTPIVQERRAIQDAFDAARVSE